MGFLNGIGNFLSGIFGGKKDDEERKKRQVSVTRPTQTVQRQEPTSLNTSLTPNFMANNKPIEQPEQQRTTDLANLLQKDREKQQQPKPEQKPQGQIASERLRQLSNPTVIQNRFRPTQPTNLDLINGTEAGQAQIKRQAQGNQQTLNKLKSTLDSSDVNQFNQLDLTNQRRVTDMAETRRNKANPLTEEGRQEINKSNTFLETLDKEGKRKGGNPFTLVDDLAKGMSDDIGDSSLGRIKGSVNLIGDKMSGKSSGTIRTAQDLDNVNELYKTGAIDYKTLMRAFKDSPALYSANVDYGISQDGGIRKLNSVAERTGEFARDTIGAGLKVSEYMPVGFASGAKNLAGRFASRALQGGTYNLGANLGSNLLNTATNKTSDEIAQEAAMSFALGGLMEGVAGRRLGTPLQKAIADAPVLKNLFANDSKLLESMIKDLPTVNKPPAVSDVAKTARGLKNENSPIKLNETPNITEETPSARPSENSPIKTLEHSEPKPSGISSPNRPAGENAAKNFKQVEPPPVEPRPEFAEPAPKTDIAHAVDAPEEQLARQAEAERAIEAQRQAEALRPLDDVEAALKEQELAPPPKEQPVVAERIETPEQQAVREMAESRQPVLTERQIADIQAKEALDNAPTEAMMQDARKYKSADEFVKAQGNPMFHATNNKFENFDPEKIGSQTDEGMWGRGFYFANKSDGLGDVIRGGNAKHIMEVYSDRGANILDISQFKSKKELADYLGMSETNFVYDNGSFPRASISQTRQFTSAVKEKGYDGVYVPHNNKYQETVIFNPDKLKTKQQLTDIYNQAHAEPTPKVEAPDPTIDPNRNWKLSNQVDEGYRVFDDTKKLISQKMDEFTKLNNGKPFTPAQKKELQPLLKQMEDGLNLAKKANTELYSASPAPQAPKVEAPQPTPALSKEITPPPVEPMPEPVVKPEPKVKVTSEPVTEPTPVKEPTPIKETPATGEKSRLVESYTDSFHKADSDEFAKLVKDKNPSQSINDKVARANAELDKTDFDGIKNLSGQKITNVDEAVKGQEALNRLYRMSQEVDEVGKPTQRALQAKEAEQTLLSHLDSFASESGLNLRSIRVAYERMTPAQKAKYWKKKLTLDDADLTVEQEDVFTKMLGDADKVGKELDEMTDTTIYSKTKNLMDDLNSGNRSTLTSDEISMLRDNSGKIESIQNDYELAVGKAVRYLQDSVYKNQPKTVGKYASQVGDYGRHSMLSSVSGRIFDLQSTGFTAAGDVGQNMLETVFGKMLNKASGKRLATNDTFISPKEMFKGGARALGDLGREVKSGIARVGNPNKFIHETGINRGDIRAPRGPVGRVVSGAVRLPDAMTSGIREASLRQQGLSNAKKLGLKGEAAEAYAEGFKLFPTSGASDKAYNMWRKANMMHDNGLTRRVEKVVSALEARGSESAAARMVGGMVKNAFLPFTRYSSGYLNRLVMEKNVVARLGTIVKGIGTKDADTAIKGLAGLARDGAEGAAIVGLALPALGWELVDHDENGKNFEGLYVKTGNNRYFPVALFGLASPSVITAYEVRKQMDGSGPASGEGLMDRAGSWIEKMFKTANVGATLGLGSTVLKVGQDVITASESGDTNKVVEALNSAGLTIANQYIPAITGDINAILDQTELNPTRERADTKVKKVNLETGREVTDQVASAIAKLQNRIPFASQQLPRQEGTVAKDMLDRSVRGGRSSEAQELAIKDQKAAAEVKKTVTELNVEYRKSGGIDTETKYKNAVNSGEWDKAIGYDKWKLEVGKLEGKLTDEDIAKKEKSIKTHELFRDNKYDAGLYKKYFKSSSKNGGVTLTEWRKMLSTDQEQASLLSEVDNKLLDAGLIDKLKYYTKGTSSSKGRRSGRSGGSGGKAVGHNLPTNLLKSASQDTGLGKQKMGERLFKAPQLVSTADNTKKSRIPTISVKKGIHL